MKEMYDWVAWHRKLAKKIAEGGRGYLVDKIVLMPDHLAKLGSNPLSFFGFLRNSQSESNEMCKAVKFAFKLETELPDPGELRDIIFPYASESLSREEAMFPNVGNDDLFWRLFEQATKNNPDIKQEDWKVAMDDGVEIATLTQALFLVNPTFFLPVDSAVDAYFPEGWREEKGEKIKGDEGYAEYLSTQEEIKKRFPGCEPYEIYTFLRWQKDKRVVSKDSKLFHISTNAHGHGAGDFWDKEVAENINFKENNWVFVGGAAPDGKGAWEDIEGRPWKDIQNEVEEKGSSPYPLLDPKQGDIVLVRTGRSRGRAIGVILKNDYDRPDGSGLNAKSKIHVLWINKLDSSLTGRVQWIAFAIAKKQTLKYFANAKSFKTSFELINQLTGKTIGSEKQVNQARQHPLNTILYGPPGTGKTYNTSHYAVAIIEDKSVDEVKEERKEKGHKGVKERFDKYRDNGQIEMVTFHQNYAYEDFIEGIRPILDQDGKKKDIKYELRKGIFREISDRAIIDELLWAFAISIQEEVEKEGEIKLSDDGGINDTIKAVERGKNDFSFKLGGPGEEKSLSMQSIKERGYYHEFLQGKIDGPSDIKNVEESQSAQLGTAPQYFALLKKIKKFHDRWIPGPRSTEEEERVKNYVLIIDEINRGNIAKIFGELITLIEDSRRLGNKEETKVTLPYSGEPFGVPDSLYIIGTMNTADRSIALLDTALRRRFEFKEMMPKPSQIKRDIEGVNLQELLAKMNERIRVLLDREHQIGHTYFINIRDIKSLKKTFQNKIIPLLQEYFYDNWEKIVLVLNQNGFIDGKPIDKFIDSDRFKKSDLVDEQGKTYEILSEDDRRWDDPESYKEIYMKSNDAQNQEQNEPGNGE